MHRNKLDRNIKMKIKLTDRPLPIDDDDGVYIPVTSHFAAYSDRCNSSLSQASSISWAEDIEEENTKKSAQLLQTFYDALYSDEQIFTGDFGEEIKQFKKYFPHFRVEGKAITIPKDIKIKKRIEREEVIASHGNITHYGI